MTQLGIYPGTWETGDHDWLIDAFQTLRDFYAGASKAGQSVVTVIERDPLAGFTARPDEG